MWGQQGCLIKGEVSARGCKSFLGVAEHLVAGFFQDASFAPRVEGMFVGLAGPTVLNMFSISGAIENEQPPTGQQNQKSNEGKGRPRRD